MITEDATPAELATAEVHQQARRMRLTVQVGVIVGLLMLAGFGIYSIVILFKVTDTLDEARAAAEESKAAAQTNQRLIERGNPCIEGDDPNSEACVAKRAADARLAEALAAVQAQHDAQARQIDEQGRQLSDAIDRLVELQLRYHGSAPNAGARPRLAPRVAADGPTTPPPDSGAPPATTAPSPAPSPPTTACEPAGKSGRCRK